LSSNVAFSHNTEVQIQKSKLFSISENITFLICSILEVFDNHSLNNLSSGIVENICNIFLSEIFDKTCLIKSFLFFAHQNNTFKKSSSLFNDVVSCL
jgi:hypothetical protein